MWAEQLLPTHPKSRATHTYQIVDSQTLHTMLGETYLMRISHPKKVVATLAIALSGSSLFSATGISIARAEPTPTPYVIPDTFKNPQERYRFERDLYLAALKNRAQLIKNINIVFKIACDKAALDYRNAMSVARTPDQKNLAVSMRKNSVSTAIVARDLAIEALGEEPVAPIEPTKPSKIQSKSKSR